MFLIVMADGNDDWRKSRFYRDIQDNQDGKSYNPGQERIEAKEAD